MDSEIEVISKEMDKFEVVSLHYGKKIIKFKIPKKNLVFTIAPNYVKGARDEESEIRKALQNSIGCDSLSEIARKKGGKAVIVINDITRPTPSCKLVPPLLDELNKGGIKDNDICIIVATGSHRGNTIKELEQMLSLEVIKRVHVINHDFSNQEMLKYIGKTKRGVPIELNRVFCEADIKILTGTISPHQSAGFSGGRKSVLPGIAGSKALMIHHSYPLRLKGPAMGRIERNPFSEEAIEAARTVGVDFILNVVQNNQKEIVKTVAGNLIEAWLEGIKWARKIHEVVISDIKPEVVISSPGGFPRDIDLYQTQKSVSPVEAIVKRGGTIIIPSECAKGIGGGKKFYNWLNEANNIEEVIERFKNEGFNESSNKAFLYARALKKAEIIIVTENIHSQILNSIFLKKATTIEGALNYSLKKYGEDCRIAVVQNAPEIIPIFK